MEYVYARIGWAAALFNMGMIHLFGRYVVMAIIVAFMKKDIESARKEITQKIKVIIPN
jgi:hypothetical protein